MNAVSVRAALAIAGLLAVPVMAATVPAQARQRVPGREVWIIDQLQLPLETPQSVLAALGPDHSLDAVVRRLKTLSVPFKRVRLMIAPDRLTPRMRELIEKLPVGEPLVMPDAGFISVNVLVGRRLPADVVHAAPLSHSAPAQEA